MPRPSSISDDQILAAARAVFLRKGISATTAEVARRAGVAEGSLFNRFKSKQGLFKAAMASQLADPPWATALEERVGEGDVRETLREVGLQIVDFLRAVLPLMMMSWSNRGGGLPAPLAMPDPPPLRLLKRVAGFFEAEMRAGRLQRHDPEILARVYLGSLQNYVFFELLMRAQDIMPLPVETYLRGVVQLLWAGAGREPRTRRAKAKSK
jgi:AcrR family transcriptional regulator